MSGIILCCETWEYLGFVNSTSCALLFSVLYLMACAGIIYFLSALRSAKINAIRNGFYLILASFVCGILLMGWVIMQG